MKKPKVKGKIIKIENPQGNDIMILAINRQGVILGGTNCELIEATDKEIRLRQLGNII